MELAKIDYTSKEVIQTLKQTVAQGATDQEFEMFRQFCQSTGLNPFKKEIWFIKAGGRVQIMTGINGFLAIANAHPQFDGMEIEVDEAVTKAVCKVYRKDRKYPSVGIALMKEFKKETPIWKNMPSVMLTKVAKSIAIREAFPQELNGLYTQEEMTAEFAVPSASEPPKAEAQVIEVPSKSYYYDINLVPSADRDKAFAYVNKLGLVRNEQGYWVSDVPRKHLEKYQVTAHVNNGKVEPMEVAQNG